jgi:hypothetical protein
MGCLALLMSMATVLSSVLSSVAAADTPDRATALRNASQFLEKQQQPDGRWSDVTGFPGGVTALCTLALLDAGVSKDDAHVQKSLASLRQMEEPSRTYTVALQAMLFSTADPKADRALIERSLRWLEANQHKSGAVQGAWGYAQARGVVDNSNTRFAVLGLEAAQRAGLRADPATWKRTLSYWLDNQNADGSWGYAPGLFGTGSMSCSGIASVVVASGKVTDDAELAQRSREAIDRGIKWLTKYYSAQRNPSVTGVELPWLFYYLNTLEAAGRLTKRPQIGQHDWYREWADVVLTRQDAQSGAWTDKANPDEGNSLIATSLAMMFLAGKSQPQPPPPQVPAQ